MQYPDTTLPPRKDDARDAARLVPTLTIMTHPNPRRIGERAVLDGLARGARVALSRTTPAFAPPDKLLGTPLDDPFISRNPVYLQPGRHGGLILDPGEGKIEVVADGHDPAEALGFSPEQVRDGVVLNVADRVVLLLHATHGRRASPGRDHGLIGASDDMAFLRAEIDRVADLDTPVLLLGASGTGKELVARAVHEAGKRGKPFVSVNLGAIPPALAASELFGALKGSFTGADRRQTGYFREAHGGTLFLDEVGEASTEVQVMLLRALETGEISPVGAQVPIKVQTRLVAATDADLAEKMAEDSFKTPLFHRLAGYEISLPPLCRRLEDLPRLFLHFAEQELAILGERGRLDPRAPDAPPWLPPHLMVRLLRCSWPGNVRQLRNAVRQILIGCRGEAVLRSVPKLEQMLQDAPPRPARPEAGSAPPTVKRKPGSIDDAELTAALSENRWDIKAAAAQLGISRTALYALIDKAPGLRKASDLSAGELEEGLAGHDGDVDALGEAWGISPRALRRRLSQLNAKP